MAAFAVPAPRFTEREYLALEAVAETRHEYMGGDILGMAGAELQHNQIAQNVRLELGNALRDKVEREYDVWRLVRDPEGVQGWVHQVTLSERRTFVVAGADATIRSGASDTAVAVALLKPGVIGRLRACDQGSKWCQVQVGTFKGYLRRDQVWGLLPDEVVTPS